MTKFITLHADGTEIDVRVEDLLLIEANDNGKNPAPLFIAGKHGQMHAAQEIEDIVDELDVENWVEVTALCGNRTLIRRSAVVARMPQGDGCLLTLEIPHELHLSVAEPLDRVRAYMSAPTYRDLPPGMQVIDQ